MPRIRVGEFMTSDVALIAELHNISKAEVDSRGFCGNFAVEVPYKRGLEGRNYLFHESLKAEKDKKAQGGSLKAEPLPLATLFLQALTKPDSAPLARKCPGDKEVGQLASGENIAEAGVHLYSSGNQKSSGAELEKKQAKRMRQEAQKTNDQKDMEWGHKVRKSYSLSSPCCSHLREGSRWLLGGP